MIATTIRLDGDDDWTLTRRGGDGELHLKIIRWSPGVERILGEHEISHVTQGGSWSEGIAVLQKLVRYAPQLRSLVTTKDPLGDVALIGEFCSLESLILQHPDTGIDYGTRKAKDIGAIAALRNLELFQVEGGSALPDLDILGGLPRLRAIGILATEIGKGPCSVLPLTKLEHLTELTLGGRPRSLKNLMDIPSLEALTALEHLALDRVPDLPSLAWIRPLRGLRHLVIRGTRVLDRDLSPVMDLPELGFLALDLRGFAPGGKVYSPSYDEVLAPSRARAAAKNGVRTMERSTAADVSRAAPGDA